MTNVYGTNLVAVAGENIKAGQETIVSDAGGTQITAETGPLSHGIFIQTADSSVYVTCDGTAPTTGNGVLVAANNPLFVPIKDPSTMKAIASASTKVITFIMY